MDAPWDSRPHSKSMQQWHLGMGCRHGPKMQYNMLATSPGTGNGQPEKCNCTYCRSGHAVLTESWMVMDLQTDEKPQPKHMQWGSVTLVYAFFLF